MDADVSGIADRLADDLDSDSFSGANLGDVSKFQNAYNGETVAHPVLDFIGSTRAEFNEQLETMAELSTSGNPSDLIRVQYAISCMIVTQDLLAKAVGKANQTLETLLKMQ